MNTFKKISNVKYYVERFKNQIPHITNRDKLVSHIKMINAIILLIDEMETVLEAQISTEAINRIVLGRFHNDITKYYPEEKNIPLEGIFKKIITDLKTPAQNHKDNINEFLEDKETLRLLANIPKVKTDNFIIDSDITNEKERAVLNSVYNESIDFETATDSEIKTLTNGLINTVNRSDDSGFRPLINELLENLKWNVEITYN